jgi:hypothetical protein
MVPVSIMGAPSPSDSDMGTITLEYRSASLAVEEATTSVVSPNSFDFSTIFFSSGSSSGLRSKKPQSTSGNIVRLWALYCQCDIWPRCDLVISIMASGFGSLF